MSPSITEATRACAAALAWLAHGSPSDATRPEPQFVLRVSGHPPADAYVVRHVFEPAFRVLRRMSGGRIGVQAFWGESAHPAKDGFAALADGRSDLAPCYTSWESAAHPMSQLLALPHLFATSEVATAVSETLYPRFFRPEFERPGVLMGRLKATGPYHLFAKKKLTRLADLEGLRVATNSGIDSRIASVLGAEPVNLRSDQLLPAFIGGQVDAVSLADGSADVFGIGVRAACRVEIGASMMNLEFGLSRAFYERLPADLQVVLNDWLRAQAQAETQVFYGLGGAMAREKFAAAGCTFAQLDADDASQLRERLDALTDTTARDMDAQGLHATAFVREARHAARSLAGHTGSQLMHAAIAEPLWLMPGARPTAI
jgi:TRAP-type C4-dicarboxylate transport system substrate-binding protein